MVGVVSYTTLKGSYDRLCHLCRTAECTLTLSRWEQGWDLQIATAPDSALGWRAAGVIFADISDLDWHANQLLALVQPSRGANGKP